MKEGKYRTRTRPVARDDVANDIAHRPPLSLVFPVLIQKEILPLQR